MDSFYRLRHPGLHLNESINTLVLICSCAATKDRREAVRETWLRHAMPSGLRAFFVIGRPGKEPTVSGDIIYVDAPDTYIGLPEKMWAAYREALSRWDFEWLCKVDDDTFLVPLRMWEYPKHQDYIGRRVALQGADPNWHRIIPSKMKVGKIPYPHIDELMRCDEYNGPWAAGGCYVLSRNAVQLVAAEPLSHVRRRSIYEDRMVGEILYSYGIQPWGKHSVFRNTNLKEGLIGAVSIHPCEPDMMRDVYFRMYRAGEMGT